LKSEALAGEIIRGRRVCGPGSEGIITTIRRWVRECDETHAKCRSLGPGDSSKFALRLPTRVLDVSSTGGNLSLFVSNGSTGAYAALSHCWGGRQHNITTWATYEAYQRRIELSSLSKTVQEAIRVTQSLGLRYLWVDSLCIIQNDEDDWRNEAMTMSDIYEQAYCTIAAAAAPDGVTGCFAQSVQDDCLVPLPHSSRTLGCGNTYLARPRKPEGLYFDGGPLVSVISGCHRTSTKAHAD
jgi:Heterokaryon incompatibility protein (HET)